MMFDHDESVVPVAKGDRVMVHSLDDGSSDDDEDDDDDDDRGECGRSGCGGRGRGMVSGTKRNNNEARRQGGVDEDEDQVGDGTLNGRLGVVLVPQAKPGFAGVCLTNGLPQQEQERNGTGTGTDKHDQLDRMVYVRYENLRICDESMTTAKHLHRPRPATREVRFQE